MSRIITSQRQADPIQKAIQKSINASCTVFVRAGRGNEWIGSGFHIFGHGHIVTAAHVVPPEIKSGGYEIILLFPNNAYYEAHIVETEPDYDCAILYAPDVIGKIPHVKLIDSNEIEVGEVCAVISSPEGMSATATVGRISNTKQGMGTYAPNPAWEKDLIIIDAEILEGSSGGMCLLSDAMVAGSIMGEFGQNVNTRGGHRAVCPSNKIAEIYRRGAKHK